MIVDIYLLKGKHPTVHRTVFKVGSSARDDLSKRMADYRNYNTDAEIVASYRGEDYEEDWWHKLPGYIKNKLKQRGEWAWEETQIIEAFKIVAFVRNKGFYLDDSVKKIWDNVQDESEETREVKVKEVKKKDLSVVEGFKGENYYRDLYDKECVTYWFMDVCESYGTELKSSLGGTCTFVKVEDKGKVKGKVNYKGEILSLTGAAQKEYERETISGTQYWYLKDGTSLFKRYKEEGYK